MTTFETKKGTKLPLLNLKGKDYLQVQHRVQWFREECPGWTIETEIKPHIVAEHGESYCLAKAIIRDPEGRVIAMAHKIETARGFGDFIEKAETGSIGRALALCGYGTQFADELIEGDRIVDAPAPRMAAMTAGGHAVTQPLCCNNRMMISKYEPNTYYCPKCKSKRPMIAVKSVPDYESGADLGEP